MSESYPGCSTVLARPKSSTLAFPSGVTSTFAGFKSVCRWTREMTSPSPYCPATEAFIPSSEFKWAKLKPFAPADARMKVPWSEGR